MGTTFISQTLRANEFAEGAVNLSAGSHLDYIFIRSKAVVSRRIAGETLIVPVRGRVGDLASIYSFNATGSLLWQALETPQGLSSLIDAVQAEYAVDRGQAEHDVRQFLKDTVSVGLVEERQEVSMAAVQAHTEIDQRGTDTPVHRF